MTRVETAFHMRGTPQPRQSEMRSSRPSPRRLALLGATGSIGRQVCDLVERHPDRFVLHALVAGSDAAALEAVGVVEQDEVLGRLVQVDVRQRSGIGAIARPQWPKCR